MLSNRFLAKACGYGTFGMVGLMLFAFDEVQTRIRKSDCYIEAFKFLHENPGAVKYFGQPLKAGFATTTTDSNVPSDTVYWYKVPLKGPDGKGTMYYKAVKEDNWFLAKVELELEQIPDRKFVIMDKNRIEDEKLNVEDDTSQEFM